MSKSLGVNYRLEIEVLTPLHIGSGQTLTEGFDFAVHNHQTYRLQEDVILEDYWPDDPRQQRLLLGKPLADLLQAEDYRQRPHYFAYILQGAPALREIVACIKDPELRPYLPGSSLKGAIRTALMRLALAREKRVVNHGDIQWGQGPQAAKRADDRLDREIFGPDPNNDLLRALQVGDSRPLPTVALTLTRIRMVPGLDIDVEAIAPGTCLSVPLRVDTYLLNQRDRRLRWPHRNADLVRNFAATCREATRERLAHEYEYHKTRRGDVRATSFYARIIEEFLAESWPKSDFLIQVGFAAGWRSKSVLGGADNTDPLLAEIVHGFNLDRGGKRKGKSGSYVQGQPFPVSRHLAYVRGEPALPMGWLRVRAVPLEREVRPSIAVAPESLSPPEVGPVAVELIPPEPPAKEVAVEAPPEEPETLAPPAEEAAPPTALGLRSGGTCPVGR